MKRYDIWNYVLQIKDVKPEKLENAIIKIVEISKTNHPLYSKMKLNKMGYNLNAEIKDCKDAVHQFELINFTVSNRLINWFRQMIGFYIGVKSERILVDGCDVINLITGAYIEPMYVSQYKRLEELNESN